MVLDFFTALASGYLILAGIWFVTLILVLITLFKRKDIGMPMKVLWAALIFVAPLLGLIFYLIYGLPKRKKLIDNNSR